MSYAEMVREGEEACRATIEEFIHYAEHGKFMHEYNPNILRQSTPIASPVTREQQTREMKLN